MKLSRGQIVLDNVTFDMEIMYEAFPNISIEMGR